MMKMDEAQRLRDVLRKAKRAGMTRDTILEKVSTEVRLTAQRENWRMSERVMALAAWTEAIRDVYGDDVSTPDREGVKQ